MAAKTNLTLRQLDKGDVHKGLSDVAVIPPSHAELLICLEPRLSGLAGAVDSSWRDL